MVTQRPMGRSSPPPDEDGERRADWSRCKFTLLRRTGFAGADATRMAGAWTIGTTSEGIWDHSDRGISLTGAPCAQDAADSVAGSPAAVTSGPCLAPMVSRRDLPQFPPDIERSRKRAHAPVTIWVSNQATAIPLKP